MALNGEIHDEGSIEKDCEGRGRGLIAVLSWHLPRGTKENCEKISVRLAGVPTEVRTYVCSVNAV